MKLTTESTKSTEDERAGRVLLEEKL